MSPRCPLSSWRERWHRWDWFWPKYDLVVEPRASLALLENPEWVEDLHPSSNISLCLLGLLQKVLFASWQMFMNWFCRFDDYSFYYDEYLDMEDCLEDIEQVIWFTWINESETKFIYKFPRIGSISGRWREVFLQWEHPAAILHSRRQCVVEGCLKIFNSQSHPWCFSRGFSDSKRSPLLCFCTCIS